MTKFYLVGGAVRDLIMGVPVKDYDYSVECESFDAMRDAIIERGGKIFEEKPEHLTIRAIDLTGEMTGIEKMATDFVMCRKDGEYTDSRRPESVTPGTFVEDLARRDFTVNAMALAVVPGENVFEQPLIDPFGGRDDAIGMVLRTVGDTFDRFDEDTLRMLRAIRFAVTKGFDLSNDIIATFSSPYFVEKMKEPKLVDRKRDELKKCFAHDTPLTMWYIMKFCSPEMVKAIFGQDLWLKPTNEKR